VAAVEGSRPEPDDASTPPPPPPQRFSSFAALGRAFGLEAPAKATFSPTRFVETPVVGGLYAGYVTNTHEEHGAFVDFLDGTTGLLHETGLNVGDYVHVTLAAITDAGKFRLAWAPAPAAAAAAKKKRGRRAEAPVKAYKGLGVRTWEDVNRLVAAGGWEFVASNSNVHWRRTTPSTKDGGQPLVQHLYLAASPSDSFHGPQKAATTMRHLDQERAAFLNDTR
jgi:predicted RNA-binding protein with RPS1 domain